MSRLKNTTAEQSPDVTAQIMCPACASHNIVHVARRPEIIIYSCAGCTLDFAIADALGRDSAFATDPNYYHDSKAQFSEQLDRAVMLVSSRLEYYTKILGRRPQKILEIGCGSGAYAKAFTNAGLAYIAIEIEPEMAEFARVSSGQNIITGDFLDVELPWQPDIVFLSQVLEHMPDPIAFMARLRKVAPGAVLHLDVPNQFGAAAVYRKYRSKNYYGSMHFPFHMIGYSATSLRKLLKSGGAQLHFLRSYRNNHPVWGHLAYSPGPIWRVYYALTQFFDCSSLLVAIARIPDTKD